MADYYNSYQEKVLSYEAYQQFLRDNQLLPINERMMNEFFNKDLYLDTQPTIPNIQKINMENKNKQILYTQPELDDINNIFNFFGSDNYSIGRAWKKFCIYYNTRFNEGLINTINDIKTEYGIP